MNKIIQFLLIAWGMASTGFAAGYKPSENTKIQYTSICEIFAHRKTWSHRHFRIKARYWQSSEHSGLIDKRCPNVEVYLDSSRKKIYDKSIPAFDNHWRLSVLKMSYTNVEAMVDASVIITPKEHSDWIGFTLTFLKVWSYKDISLPR
jgi:hypothetical protein